MNPRLIGSFKYLKIKIQGFGVLKKFWIFVANSVNLLNECLFKRILKLPPKKYKIL